MDEEKANTSTEDRDDRWAKVGDYHRVGSMKERFDDEMKRPIIDMITTDGVMD